VDELERKKVIAFLEKEGYKLDWTDEDETLFCGRQLFEKYDAPSGNVAVTVAMGLPDKEESE
jgi:hypothetical protein